MAELTEFRSAKTVLRRATAQVQEFSAEIDAFTHRTKMLRTVEYHSSTKEYVVKVKLDGEIPESVAAVAKDALGNLRDCLDQSVYASALAVSGHEPAKTKFMAGKTREVIQKELKGGNYKGVPAEILTLMWSFEPYEGGNRILFALNNLRNTKSHRALVPIIRRHGAITLTLSAIPQGGFHLVQMGGPEIWDPVGEELVLARLGTRPTEELAIETDFIVAFDGTTGVDNEPAIAFMEQALSEVERIVAEIEAATIEICARLAS